LFQSLGGAGGGEEGAEEGWIGHSGKINFVEWIVIWWMLGAKITHLLFYSIPWGCVQIFVSRLFFRPLCRPSNVQASQSIRRRSRTLMVEIFFLPGFHCVLCRFGEKIVLFSPDTKFWTVSANWVQINWPASGRVIFLSSFARFSGVIYDFLQSYTLLFTNSWLIVSKLSVFKDRLSMCKTAYDRKVPNLNYERMRLRWTENTPWKNAPPKHLNTLKVQSWSLREDLQQTHFLGQYLLFFKGL
jgi:hypothetical protein